MIDKSSLLKSQDNLCLEFISKDGLFHKMLLLSLMGFLTGVCNLKLLKYYVILPEFRIFYLEMIPIAIFFFKKSAIIEKYIFS